MFKRIIVPLLIAALFAGVPVALGAPGPQDVTNQSCSFGTQWADGLSRFLFGISVLLFAMAAISALASAGRSAGGEGGGGHIISGAVGNVAGIGIVMGLLGAATLFAAIATVAAGGTACP